MYQADPRISRENDVVRLQQIIDDFIPINTQETPELETVDAIQANPIVQPKQTVICQTFSNQNLNVTLSSNMRVLKKNGGYSYCFLNHPRIKNNEILQWTLSVPNFLDGKIGTIIILELFTFCL